MPLPSPELDNRTFQDIVTAARNRIAVHCPEWTDHNLSDPGITLIELFAWMTEMLLYRVNQIPDKMYTAFLELLGYSLEPPRPATAKVTFYLASPVDKMVPVPKETEVATLRTENNPAIPFFTRHDLEIQPAKVNNVVLEGKTYSLQEFKDSLKPINLFSSQPNAKDIFFIALENNLSRNLLKLDFEFIELSGEGIDPDKPPRVWEVQCERTDNWVPCVVEKDTTGGFNRGKEPGKGYVLLQLPPGVIQGTRDASTHYWLRCRPIRFGDNPTNFYAKSPQINDMHIETLGGTVDVVQAEVARNEVLGRSNGKHGQDFQLQHSPLLGREEDDYLEVISPDGEARAWKEVPNFANSTEDDYHYTLTYDGVLTLGPMLIQADGQAKQYGHIPEKGSQLRFRRYRYGGGQHGNVAAGAISVIKNSLPYINEIRNSQQAVGGKNPESLELVKLRASNELRTRYRAVTAEDYEILACEEEGVARACCITPGAQPPGTGNPPPGTIYLKVLPDIVATQQQYITSAQLKLPASLQESLETKLNKHRLLGTKLEISQADSVDVKVDALIHISNNALTDELERLINEELYRYLSPNKGGPQGTGWPFGRNLRISEIYGSIQRVLDTGPVEGGFIKHAQLFDSANNPMDRISVPPGGVICSLKHTVKVYFSDE
jgi:predicted phage baseplate assembly protein